MSVITGFPGTGVTTPNSFFASVALMQNGTRLYLFWDGTNNSPRLSQYCIDRLYYRFSTLVYHWVNQRGANFPHRIARNLLEDSGAPNRIIYRAPLSQALLSKRYLVNIRE
jgi:hypothetical protein